MVRPPQRYELAGAGGDVRYTEDTGTVGRNITTPSPKPSITQPSQNGSNKKPVEDKGTGEIGTSIPSRLKSTPELENHIKYRELIDSNGKPHPNKKGIVGAT
ncbi:hypothetical protein [Lysinibacillus fusiformis]|uniref:hypothetical protein n=1 Tax=Lysinibacillus fusiformis TaxID=28031 RepID=UPI0021C14A03|nr:hypothetical protein [Lysinibacillus fusiformis]UXJ67418.1 hypothetical protein N5069_14695 [Lysinibacillus fusiformis]